MSNYANTYGGAAKDAAQDIILGGDLDTEFDAIATHSATKADKIISGTNTNLMTMDSNGNLADSGVLLAEMALLAAPALTGAATLDGTALEYLSMPAGTVCLFVQTAAPTGWTKGATHNDKLLRVITGTVGSGGAVDFSTFAADVATGDVTLTHEQSGLPEHFHTILTGDAGSSAHPLKNGLQTSNGATEGVNGGATDAAEAHSHSLAQDIKYVDIIIATRD